MVIAFGFLGVNIREHHYSSEVDVNEAARKKLTEVRIIPIDTIFGKVYQIAHFTK